MTEHHVLTCGSIDPDAVNHIRRFFRVHTTENDVPVNVAACLVSSEASGAEALLELRRRFPKSLIILLDGETVPASTDIDLAFSKSSLESELKALALVLNQQSANRRARRCRAIMSWALPSVLLLALLLVWQGVLTLLQIPPYMLPAPSKITADFLHSTWPLLTDLTITMLESVAGFSAGAILAFATAVIMAHSVIAERAVYPWAIALKTVPLIAIAPLLVVWLGNGYSSKVAMSALICFFPVLVNTLEGLRSVPPEAMALFKVLAASRRQVFVMLRLPLSVPYIFSGLKISTTLSVIGAIVAELSGSREGMGHVILVASGQGDVARVFSGAALVSLGSLAFFGVISALDQFIRKDGRLWRVQ